MIIYPFIGTISTSGIKTASPLLTGLDTKRREIIITNLGNDPVFIKRGAAASDTNFDFFLVKNEKVVIDNWQNTISCYPATGVSVNVAVLQ